MSEKDILNHDSKNRILKNVNDMFKKQDYIDVIELAKMEGITVKGVDNINRSAYIQKEGSSYTIYVNGREKLARQRFSIAHEIAHYILHKDNLDKLAVIDRCGSNSLSHEQESDADELAGELLMPKDILANLLCKDYSINESEFITKEIIEKLTDKFKVTFFAMIVRLRVIGYKIPYIALYER